MKRKFNFFEVAAVLIIAIPLMVSLMNLDIRLIIEALTLMGLLIVTMSKKEDKFLYPIIIAFCLISILRTIYPNDKFIFYGNILYIIPAIIPIILAVVLTKVKIKKIKVRNIIMLATVAFFILLPTICGYSFWFFRNYSTLYYEITYFNPVLMSCVISLYVIYRLSDTNKKQNSSTVGNEDIVDQLTKITELKEKKLIDEEEFNSLKEKVMNNSKTK